MIERVRLTLVREKAPPPYGTQLLKAADVVGMASDLLASEAQEIVLAFYLDQAHRVRTYQEVGRGGFCTARCDPKVVFGAAMLTGASALILVHNHPSQQLAPSIEDRALTRTIRLGGQLLELELLDHVIVAGDQHVSAQREGWL